MTENLLAVIIFGARAAVSVRCPLSALAMPVPVPFQPFISLPHPTPFERPLSTWWARTKRRGAC